MQVIMESISNIITHPRTIEVIKAIAILSVGLFIAKIAATSINKLFKKRFEAHELQLIRRGCFYGVLILFFLSALNQLGLNLSVVLGAAGILSVALGFASQTSASNLISGLFLLVERPFSVGDIIRVGSTSGEVLSVDLLSLKLRTFDNLYVRIPNESLIKSEVTTLTKFPIRRFDMQVGVAYKEDLEKVKEVLFDVAHNNPLCLENPKPLFIFQGFGTSSLDIQFSVWAKKENFLDLRNTFFLAVKAAFDKENIEIPFPHTTIYTGSETRPFPVAVAENDKLKTSNKE